ncbi:hypothetical protein RRG08_054182 [Elysia crispata]|uniref:Uncharacterized protein n=1 Tax=Elysia crispata TaxID=231223 RepID=A0AAE1A2A4_9GAST|nr:hypothetical protein RRG08_054182 [Elysia crispata]
MPTAQSSSFPPQFTPFFLFPLTVLSLLPLLLAVEVSSSLRLLPGWLYQRFTPLVLTGGLLFTQSSSGFQTRLD